MATLERKSPETVCRFISFNSAVFGSLRIFGIPIRLCYFWSASFAAPAEYNNPSLTLFRHTVRAEDAPSSLLPSQPPPLPTLRRAGLRSRLSLLGIHRYLRLIETWLVPTAGVNKHIGVQLLEISGSEQSQG
ncbi:hypothetical protein VTI74DRAFT_3107 [Chaetomium olivicolor]